MQNRYAGDLGDFLKLSLIRWMSAGYGKARPLQLGVVWYLVPDESHNADGKHVTYLDVKHRSATRFRSLDPDLYARLASMTKTEPNRSVKGLERCGALPAAAVTFGEPLSFADLATTDKLARASRRQHWLESAMAATAPCDLVFLDPDNGLRSNLHNTPRHRNKSEKHAYLDEINAFLDRGQSVIVYHHADRSAPVPEQATRRLAEVAAECSGRPLAAVRASAGTVRLFLVVAAPGAEQRLTDRLQALTVSAWASELQVYYWNNEARPTNEAPPTGEERPRQGAPP